MQVPAINLFDIIPHSTTGAYPNIVSWSPHSLTVGTETLEWEYKPATKIRRPKRKRSTIHKPCRCGSGMNFNHCCNRNKDR